MSDSRIPPINFPQIDIPQTSVDTAAPKSLEGVQSTPLPDTQELKETFTRFVTGTFYREMMKSLRSTESEVPYIGGGPGAKIFRQQLDEQFIEQFSSHDGSAFADSLYAAFEAQATATWSGQASAAPTDDLRSQSLQTADHQPPPAPLPYSEHTEP